MRNGFKAPMYTPTMTWSSPASYKVNQEQNITDAWRLQNRAKHPFLDSTSSAHMFSPKWLHKESRIGPMEKLQRQPGKLELDRMLDKSLAANGR
jgi:hypothetical protein